MNTNSILIPCLRTQLVMTVAIWKHCMLSSILVPFVLLLWRWQKRCGTCFRITIHASEQGNAFIAMVIRKHEHFSKSISRLSKFRIHSRHMRRPSLTLTSYLISLVRFYESLSEPKSKFDKLYHFDVALKGDSTEFISSQSLGRILASRDALGDLRVRRR